MKPLVLTMGKEGDIHVLPPKGWPYPIFFIGHDGDTIRMTGSDVWPRTEWFEVPDDETTGPEMREKLTCLVLIAGFSGRAQVTFRPQHRPGMREAAMFFTADWTPGAPDDAEKSVLFKEPFLELEKEAQRFEDELALILVMEPPPAYWQARGYPKRT